jgi:2-phospho-L-lactate transferase/gluconeogenesis factor (CofD/UPF0052 family)
MTAPEQSDQLHITVFGGGGGGSVMAGGLVEAMPDADISVVVPTGDSGSKTGELRAMFGGPAVGDVRKVLAAVAGNRRAGELFGTRFGEGDTLEDYGGQLFDSLVLAGKDADHVSKVLERTSDVVTELGDRGSDLRGHTFGNLILTAFGLDNGGDIMPGIVTTSEWLDARATVIPVTTRPHNVVMHDRRAGKIIKGEGLIDEYIPEDASQVDVWLEPSPYSDNREIVDPIEIEEALAAREYMQRPRATRQAMGAIATADVALLAPGSPWTSHMPALLPRGVAGALRAQRDHNGLWIAVANLFEEKPGLDLRTHIQTIEGSSGRSLTHLIHNTSTEGLPAGKIPLRFSEEDFRHSDAVAVGEALVDSNLVDANADDPIAHLRSPGHHDIWKVAQILGGIVKTA